MLKKVWWDVLLGILLAAAGLFVAERLLESQLNLQGPFGEAVIGLAAMVGLLFLATLIRPKLHLCVLWPSLKNRRFTLESADQVRLVYRLKLDLPGFVALLFWILGAAAYGSYRLAGQRWYLAVLLHFGELGFAVMLSRWWRGQAERLGLELNAVERGRQRMEADAAAQAATGKSPVSA